MTDPKREAMIARIRALTQKTTANGCTEAEAKAAAEAVDRLLELYEIDLSDVTVRGSEVFRIDIAGVGKHSVRYAAKSIGQFADCKCWLEGNGANLVYLGLEVDTEICEYLCILFMRAIDRESSAYTMFNADYATHNAAGRKEMALSFRIGLATRLGERLGELKSKRDFARKEGGNQLVVVKGELVDRAFANLGIVLGKGSSGHSVRDAGAYLAGRNAAEGVAIHQGVRNSRGAGARIR